MKVNESCLRRVVVELINDMGVGRGTAGSVRGRDAIMYSVLHEDFEIYPQMKDIYAAIGRQYYPDIEDDKLLYYKIESVCRRAINSTYNKTPHTELWDKMFDKYKPSASEFIRTCADIIVDKEILTDEAEKEKTEKFIDFNDEMKNEIKIYISSEVRKAIREFFHDLLDK